jgi:hypothetical protein
MILFDQLDARPRRPSCFVFFSQEIYLDRELPDLGVEVAALAFEILASGLFTAGPEDAGGALDHGLLLFGNLVPDGSQSSWQSAGRTMPLSASSATRALNSGSCLLRLAFILSGLVWVQDALPTTPALA